MLAISVGWAPASGVHYDAGCGGNYVQAPASLKSNDRPAGDLFLSGITWNKIRRLLTALEKIEKRGWSSERHASTVGCSFLSCRLLGFFC